MNIFFSALAIIVILIYIGAIFYLLHTKKLYLKYALLWLFTGVIMIALILFPQMLQWFFTLCGFQVFSNGLFAVLVFFILIILLALTSIVSRLNEANRKLVQTVALLERRIRELEEKCRTDF